MSNDERFRFVSALAGDLNRGDVRLPSFPDVVVRIRAALDDPDCTGEQLAKIVAVEPVLASRILVVANSSYHNPAGARIASLTAAVGRVGFEKVRTTAITFAVEQLYAADLLGELRNELRRSWTHGLRTAALSESIAARCTSLDSDAAFLAGLLHRIGALYVYMKYRDYPQLLGDAEARAALIEEWQAPIGESIVSNWDFPDDVVATVNPHADAVDRKRFEASLIDVVLTADRSIGEQRIVFEPSDELERLKIDENQFEPIVAAYQARLDSLTSAVGH